MQKNVILWILAFLITVANSVHQRVIGPSYPILRPIHLTNKKTLIDMIRWIIVIFMYKRNNFPKGWTLLAYVILIVGYLIPHNV